MTLDDNPTDPKENPVNSGHLPVSGEAGVGPAVYHDPLTIDTDDDPDHQPDDISWQPKAISRRLT